MELNDTQKQAVKTWVSQGADVSEIQKRLEADFGLKITYMDVRFLLMELDVTPQDKDTPLPSTPVEHDISSDPSEGGAGDGAVSVSFDKVVQPGAVISGSATFSDGVTATWMLDATGRLALNASTPDYHPSESDLQSFQLELREGLQKMGY